MKTKKILAALLSSAMVLGTMAVPVFADDVTIVTTQAELGSAFSSGGSIQLGTDIELGQMLEIPQGKTVTLDLAGHTLSAVEYETGRHYYAFNNKGVLTIKDSVGTGAISARGIYNGYNGTNIDVAVEGAKMTIESGNLNALDSNGGAAVFNCAELVVNDGTFYGYSAAVNNRTEGTVVINGGTFRSSGGPVKYAIQNSYGTLTINNATVDQGFGAVGTWGGTTIINNGTFYPTGGTAMTCHVVYVDDTADVTVNGGTYKMNYPADAKPDSGSAVTSYYGGTANINGGTFYSHFDNTSPVELSSGAQIKGGTYYNHSGAVSTHSYIKSYIADGYYLDEETGEVKSNGIVQIGSDKYMTLQDAFDAVKDGETIELLADIDQEDGFIFNKSGVSAKLDLGDHEVIIEEGSNCNYRAIRIDNGSLEVYNGTIGALGGGETKDDGFGCYGTFRVEANGVLNAHDLYLCNSRPWGLNVKVCGGEATLTNVQIDSNYGGGIEVTEADLGSQSKPGKATLTGCTISQLDYYDHCSTALSVSGGSELTVNSGSYSSENYVLYVFSSGGVIDVNGGYFSADGEKPMIVAAIDTNTYPSYTGGLDISGGVFSGTYSITSPAYMNITGGTFSADPHVYVAKDYIEVPVNNKYYVKPSSQLIESISDSVTIKSGIDEEGYYEQVSALVTNIQGDTKDFNVTTSGDRDTQNITNQKITLKDIGHYDGDVLCGLIIKNIPEGVTVTVTAAE